MSSQWTIEEARLDRRCIFILYINNPVLNLNLEGMEWKQVCTHSGWIKRRYRRYIPGIKKEVGEKEKEMSEKINEILYDALFKNKKKSFWNNEKERYIRP